jgi:muramoyltetrapeptide carboxypeptidase
MKASNVLQAGDKLGIAAPSSAFDKKSFLRGIKVLESWGLKPVFAKNIFSGHRTFAGTHERRRKELQSLLDRSDLKAVFFARGGFGLHYILPEMSFSKLKKYPKTFIGYSDVTLLLNEVSEQTRSSVLYGPSVCDLGSTLSKSGCERVRKTLFEKSSHDFTFKGGQVIRSGHAEGTVSGGCLTLLNMSVGTSFEIKTRNRILLIEDVNEALYCVERLLLHLKQAKKFLGARGIIFGRFEAAKTSQKDWKEMLCAFFADFKGPVLYGARFGHLKNPLILPLGTRAVLDTKKQNVQIW